MKDTIIQSFDTWTDAQGIKSRNRVKSIDNISLEGIARLRELILELAIRGKLVPQDPNDEPASELLKKIEREKTKLVKEGKLKKEKPLPAITDDEKPFELPEGWEWVRIGNITNKIGSGSTPRGGSQAYTQSGILFLRSQNVRNEGLLLDDVAYISEKTNEKMSNTIVLPNDILLNITGGSLGRSTIFPEEMQTANVSQHVTIIRPTILRSSVYLHGCVLSPYFQDMVWGRQVGANREGLSKKVLEMFEIPLPPLAEQHRIVAKVDELMALCDQLEAEQTTHLKTHQQLVKTLLQTLTEAVDAGALQAAWQRMSVHFDTLFCTEDSIDQLKQTILQLAIMGKLVPQNPTDEPASELLKKIAQEKAKLIKEGKLKKEKPLPAITDDEKPFELPEGWELVRLGEIVKINGGKRLPNSQQLVKEDTGRIYIRVTDMKNGSIDDSDLHFLTEASYSKIKKYFIEKDDIYLVIVGSTIGKSGIVPEKFHMMNLTENAVKLKAIIFDRLYLNYALKSMFMLDQFSDRTNQLGQPKLAIVRIQSSLFTLPPLAEQHRIVAKIDELMALCEKLSESILKAQDIKVSLSQTIVENAVA